MSVGCLTRVTYRSGGGVGSFLAESAVIFPLKLATFSLFWRSVARRDLLRLSAVPGPGEALRFLETLLLGGVDLVHRLGLLVRCLGFMVSFLFLAFRFRCGQKLL